MIKFEKDNYIMYFKTAEDAAQWLVEEWDAGGEFESILEDEFYTFGYWLSDHYSALDILTMQYTYEELYEEYMEGLVYDIYHDNICYFERVEDEE